MRLALSLYEVITVAPVNAIIFLKGLIASKHTTCKTVKVNPDRVTTLAPRNSRLTRVVDSNRICPITPFKGHLIGIANV